MGILEDAEITEKIRRSPNYELVTHIIEEVNRSSSTVAAIGVMAKHLRSIAV
jgi:hypothetical protein